MPIQQVLLFGKNIFVSLNFEKFLFPNTEQKKANTSESSFLQTSSSYSTWEPGLFERGNYLQVKKILPQKKYTELGKDLVSGNLQTSVCLLSRNSKWFFFFLNINVQWKPCINKVAFLRNLQLKTSSKMKRMKTFETAFEWLLFLKYYVCGTYILKENLFERSIRLQKFTLNLQRSQPVKKSFVKFKIK